MGMKGHGDEDAVSLSLESGHRRFLRLGGICGLLFGPVVAIDYACLATYVPILAATSSPQRLQAIHSLSLIWTVGWTTEAVSDLLLLVMFAAFYAAFKHLSHAATSIGYAFMILAVAIGLSVVVPLNLAMVGVSNSFYLSTSSITQETYSAVADLGMGFSNLATDISVTLLSLSTALISFAMLRSTAFRRTIGYWGMAASICSLPIVVLIPWVGYGVLGIGGLLVASWGPIAGYRLYTLGKTLPMSAE